MRIMKFEKITVKKVVTVLLPFIIATDYILVTIATKNLEWFGQALHHYLSYWRTQVAVFLLLLFNCAIDIQKNNNKKKQ
ncbi:hypothetical protein [Bacillus cereus group sp. IBL03679]|uniref:hypothetical protein n=1 Tax=Bacillus cereus group sp. IBL03679 TaxID=3240095 RepID=UPI003D2F5E29